MDANRKRTEQIKFWATPEEKAMILKKMELAGIVHLGAYLRKMAIDGMTVRLELTELNETIRLLGIANRNINQIAKKLHRTGHIYAEDVEEIRQRIDGIYEELRKLMGLLAKLP